MLIHSELIARFEKKDFLQQLHRLSKLLGSTQSRKRSSHLAESRSELVEKRTYCLENASAEPIAKLI